MMVVKSVFWCACLALNLTSLSRAQEWRKLVPLHSTRADVERLFGPAEKSYGVIYELKTGNLFVVYSTGFCGGPKREGWNVPEDTVVSYRFSPKVKQRLADLNLDRGKFRRIKDTHVGGIDYYVNEAEGITYEVQGGEVGYVEYYPSQKYKHLYCEDSPAIGSRGKETSP